MSVPLHGPDGTDIFRRHGILEPEQVIAAERPRQFDNRLDPVIPMAIDGKSDLRADGFPRGGYQRRHVLDLGPAEVAVVLIGLERGGHIDVEFEYAKAAAGHLP